MAGVPLIMRAMLETIPPTLKTGRKVASRTVRRSRWGGIAALFSALQDEYPDVKMGSYPPHGRWRGAHRAGAALARRSVSKRRLACARFVQAHCAAGIAGSDE